jgi:Arc/MetJ-type ribon-helix-helix transcriptional regulator
MNVQLPDTWRSFLQAQVQSGLFSSETEVVEASLRLLQERDRTLADGGKATPAHQPIWDAVEGLARAIWYLDRSHPPLEPDSIPPEWCSEGAIL